MKNLFKIIALFFLFLICRYQASSQERFNLYAGVGVPDQFVIGPRIQFDQVKLGVGIGNSKTTHSISGDVSYYFGENSKKFGRKLFYIKGGISQWIDHTDFPEEDKYYPLGFYFRTGRDINLSNKIGLNIELGILTGKLANELSIFSNSSVLPCIGMFLFYRI